MERHHAESDSQPRFDSSDAYQENLRLQREKLRKEDEKKAKENQAQDKSNKTGRDALLDLNSKEPNLFE